MEKRCLLISFQGHARMAAAAQAGIPACSPLPLSDLPLYTCASLSLSFFESHYFLSRSRLQLCQENYTIDVSLLRALRALQSAKAALLPHISAIISTTATHTFCSSGTDTDTIVSQTTYLSCVRAVHSLLAAAFRRCSLCFHPYALMHHTHIYNRRVLRSSIAP